MNKIKLPGLAIDLILLGGQSFCWDKLDEGKFVGFDKEGIIELEYDGENLYWQTYPEQNDFAKIKEYFRLDVNHEPIHDLIFFDEKVKTAHSYSKTIRLLKQDFEIAFFSFIISQNNSLPIIRYRIRKLSEKYGERIKHNGQIYYLFPSTEILAVADIEDLKACKLGYRAQYVKSGAIYLLENADFASSLKYSNIHNEDEIRKWLTSVKGIGEKVADCILLYGLSFDNVFPMDLWGKRILSKFYGIPEKSKYSKMRNWVKAYFRGYAGWAGQYLFEYARNNWKDLKNS